VVVELARPPEREAARAASGLLPLLLTISLECVEEKSDRERDVAGLERIDYCDEN
jgi:hypothetical protein